MSSYSQSDNSEPIYANMDAEIPCPSLLDVLDFLKFPDLTELNKIQWDEGEELDNIIKYLNENSMASDTELSESSSIPETSDLSETIQNKSVQDTESMSMQSDYPETQAQTQVQTQAQTQVQTQAQTQQSDSSEMPLDTYNGEIDEPFKKSNYMYNYPVPSNKSKSTSERYSEDDSEDSSDDYSEGDSEYYSEDDEYEA